VTLVVGEAEMGKSYLYTYFASVISQGGVFVDGEPSQQANVVIMSTEDTPEEVIRPRADAFGVNNKAIFLTEFFKDENNEEHLITMQDIDVLENVIQRVNPKLIVVDPYIAFKGAGDSNSGDDVRAVLTPLSRLAIKYDLGILAIEHPNKNTEAKASMRSAGSYQYHATVRSKLVVGPNFQILLKNPLSQKIRDIKND
jgi:RecA-family ATPase